MAIAAPRTHATICFTTSHDPGMDSKLDSDTMVNLIPRIYEYIVLCTLAGTSHRIFEFVVRESFI